MSTADQLTTYGELADVINNLPLLIRERRRQWRLSLRAAATQVGLSAATLSRVENGQDLDGKNLRAILRWLDCDDMAPRLHGVEKAPEGNAGAPTPVTATTEAHGRAGEAQEGSQ